MIFCTQCGNQLNDDTVFCPKCGTPIPQQPQSQGFQPAQTGYDTQQSSYQQPSYPQSPYPQPQYPQPQYPQPPYPQPQRRFIDTTGVMVWSIINVFLCWPISIASFVYLSKVNKAASQEEAESSYRNAKTSCAVATVVGILSIIIILSMQ